jgi:hypothetical protein
MTSMMTLHIHVHISVFFVDVVVNLNMLRLAVPSYQPWYRHIILYNYKHFTYPLTKRKLAHSVVRSLRQFCDVNFRLVS